MAEIKILLIRFFTFLRKAYEWGWKSDPWNEEQTIYESYLIVPEKAQKLSELVCPYCHRKYCISPIPRDAPGYILDAFYGSYTLSTCKEAQRIQREQTGYSYNDIIRLVTMLRKI